MKLVSFLLAMTFYDSKTSKFRGAARLERQIGRLGRAARTMDRWDKLFLVLQLLAAAVFVGILVWVLS